ncbi:MAG: hypothetical protein ACI8PZ_000410 [Myxococcota bacterium]|jgi:hypothetical protein
MTKVATIASLVRNAARSEQDFLDTVVEVFEEDDVDRTWEFFDRLNIPRSVGAEGGLHEPLPTIENVACLKIWDYAAEDKISKGVQRFLDRHERKIRWHAGHPSLEGSQNVLLLFRASMMITNLRLRRLRRLMRSKDELNPREWSIARTLMNRSYLSFRNFLGYVANDWIDAMQGAVAPAQLATVLGTFYELVDNEVRQLEEIRDALEERRLEMTVLPEGYPPVKPPNYFGGDLLGRGPWKQYWQAVNTRAHHFRESVG